MKCVDAELRLEQDDVQSVKQKIWTEETNSEFPRWAKNT
jgi:hypothetical protein